jgi:thioester reductase-like protein
VTKTAIFFNDPYWLNFQLSEDTERGNIKKSGYEYNLQERNEAATPQLPDSSEVQVTWEDEDGYGYAEEKEEELKPQSGEEQSNNEPFNIPQFKQIETVQGESLDQLIPIEPYHTVDYFASQGIKLSHSFEKDELGTKVKSFTDWLRTMKKLQPEAPEIRSNESLFPQLNKKDVQQAAHEIITEAMAEVYLKQGLKEKAIEVYNKLSLQNPANKHIFAAKISLIKENNL